MINARMFLRGTLSMIVVGVFVLLMTNDAGATSQWSRKTGLSCNACHSVFPRLNSFGEEFLRNGYQLESPKARKGPPEDEGGMVLEKVENLLGFRLNMTPIMWETNSFQKDDGASKETRLTLGSPIWIQFFVAGSIYDDISFFSELEYAKSSFKFNWFYFNFTNLFATPAVNFQVGNISPLEFASYPDRLPQLPNIKGEVFHVLSSNGLGENSNKIRNAHPGVQYYGRFDWALVYAGISPGVSATAVSQFNEYWGGIVLKMPESAPAGFGGSTATLHYHLGTDSKYTGKEKSGPQIPQVTNEWTRVSPQVNIRYNDKLDIQAAYLMAEDKNWALVTNPASSFKYSGVAVEAGYLASDHWHVGMHYDKYSSDDKLPSGKPVLDYQRLVPVATYILNYNMRFSVYYETDMTDLPSDQKTDKIYLNIRMMF